MVISRNDRLCAMGEQCTQHDILGQAAKLGRHNKEPICEACGRRGYRREDASLTDEITVDHEHRSPQAEGVVEAAKASGFPRTVASPSVKVYHRADFPPERWAQLCERHGENLGSKAIYIWEGVEPGETSPDMTTACGRPGVAISGYTLVCEECWSGIRAGEPPRVCEPWDEDPAPPEERYDPLLQAARTLFGAGVAAEEEIIPTLVWAAKSWELGLAREITNRFVQAGEGTEEWDDLRRRFSSALGAFEPVRRMIASDIYRPHSFEEISELVAPEVAARLDPHEEYGIQWYNRQRVTERTVSEPDGNGGRRYRKRRTYKWRPKEEWIAIPIPAYLPRELVDRARALVGSGRARERKHLTREWELRGMMRCGCGWKMGTRTAQTKGRLFHYYVCKRSPAARRVGECAQRCVRATSVEDVVWRFVSELLKDPDRIKAGLEELIEQERNLARDDLGQEARLWEEKISECTRLRSAYQDQQAAGLMTLEELGSKLAKLEEIRRVAEAELAALDAREERVRELEADRDALIASYAEEVSEALDELSGEERMRIYEMLQLEVRPDPEGYEVSGAFCSSRPRGRRR
jgi:hypothetical protein